MYSVKLETFEGPLDLLLHLVDKNQLDITEISLAKICREYEEYLTRLQELCLEIESSFLTVFASLLQIKSKILLPKPPPEPEEEEEEETEHELVVRLKEYRRFKLAAAKLENMADRAAKCFTRPADEILIEGDPVFWTQTTPEDLMDMYVNIMRNMGKNPEAEHVVNMEVDKISFPLILKMISKKMKNRITSSLQDLFDSPPTRIQFIVTFLVLLEMAKRNRISLQQDPGEELITIVNTREAEKIKELEKAG